jgi:hypothetical protein
LEELTEIAIPYQLHMSTLRGSASGVQGLGSLSFWKSSFLWYCKEQNAFKSCVSIPKVKEWKAPALLGSARSSEHCTD